MSDNIFSPQPDIPTKIIPVMMEVTETPEGQIKQFELHCSDSLLHAKYVEPWCIAMRSTAMFMKLAFSLVARLDSLRIPALQEMPEFANLKAWIIEYQRRKEEIK